MSVLSVAQSQIGIKESPANSNRVKYNTWYYGKAVQGSAYPWCAVFIAWCFMKAGESGKISGIKNKAYCPSWLEWGRKDKKTRTSPKAGYIVLFDWDHDGVADHIGIIEKVIDSRTIQTIEGNTAVGNNSNGGQVMRRTRNASSVIAYLDCSGSSTPAKQSTPAKKATGKLAVDGIIGNASVKALQKKLGTTQDGVITGQDATQKKYLTAITAIKYGKGGSPCVKALQKKAGAVVDGYLGRNTVKALQNFLNKNQGAYKLTVDGYLGTNTAKALQTWLNK